MKLTDTIDMTAVFEDAVEQLYRAVCAYCSGQSEKFSAEGWLLMTQDGGVKAYPVPDGGAPLTLGVPLCQTADRLADRLKEAAFEDVRVCVCPYGRSGETQTAFSGEECIFFRLFW